MNYEEELAKACKAVRDAGSIMAAKLPKYKVAWILNDMYSEYDYTLTWNPTTRRCYIKHKDAPEFMSDGSAQMFPIMVVLFKKAFDIHGNIMRHEKYLAYNYGLSADGHPVQILSAK